MAVPNLMMLTTDTSLRKSLRDITGAVWKKHRAVTQQAMAEWWALVEEHDRVAEVREFVAAHYLEAERRARNRPHYAQAAELTERLSVEPPRASTPIAAAAAPASVRERVTGSLVTLMTTTDTGAGYTGRRPVAALRAFLRVRVKVDGKVVNPGALYRHEMLAYAEKLEAQGRGCFEHAALFRDLWAVTREGERGLDAVRRLEAS